MDRALLWRLTQVSIPGRGRPRLDQISVEIPAGVTAILGPSGAGKTTLLNLLVGFERPRSGTVERIENATVARELPGNQTKAARLPVFWVPPGHGLWPHITVRHHLASIAPEDGLSIDSLLNDFDLTPLAQALPATLSQGERDRLALARALASGARVLVLDEPLAHVPDEAANRYWTRLRTVAQQHSMSCVMATHDLAVAAREADHVVLMEAGRITSSGRTGEVLAHHLAEQR